MLNWIVSEPLSMSYNSGYALRQAETNRTKPNQTKRNQNLRKQFMESSEPQSLWSIYDWVVFYSISAFIDYSMRNPVYIYPTDHPEITLNCFYKFIIKGNFAIHRCECSHPETFSVREVNDKTAQICLKTFYFTYKCNYENSLAPLGWGDSESISVSGNWARMQIDLSPRRSCSERTFYDSTRILREKGLKFLRPGIIPYRTLHSNNLIWAVCHLFPRQRWRTHTYSVSGNHWPGEPRDLLKTTSARKFRPAFGATS